MIWFSKVLFIRIPSFEQQVLVYPLVGGEFDRCRHVESLHEAGHERTGFSEVHEHLVDVVPLGVDVVPVKVVVSHHYWSRI